MCPPKPKIVVQQPRPQKTVAAPQKTDVDVQKSAEEERRRLNISQSGLPSLVLTSGLGDTSSVASRGVVLGGV